MALLTPQQASSAGIVATYVAATSTGDTFKNDGKTLLYVKNGDVSSKTVTINSQQQCSHGFDHDIVVTIAAGTEKVIGPFEANRFNNATQEVEITYSAVTSVTVAAIKL